MNEFIVPEEKIEELQNLCLEKINGTNIEDLLKHKNLLCILYRWKEWDKEDKWKGFIQEVEKDNQKLLSFVTKFVSESMNQAIGDYGVEVVKKVIYKNLSEDLSDFLDLEQIKRKLEEIKKQNSEEYNSNKKIVDLFLDNFDKKDKGDLD